MKLNSPHQPIMRGIFRTSIGGTSLSAEKYRARMAELNVEIEKLQHEMSEKRQNNQQSERQGRHSGYLPRGCIWKEECRSMHYTFSVRVSCLVAAQSHR